MNFVLCSNKVLFDYIIFVYCLHLVPMVSRVYNQINIQV